MNQITFDELFADDTKEVIESSVLSPLHKAIIALLESGETSAIEICEKLIHEGKLTNERYSTHKPKAYSQVCSFLENLVQHGKILFIEDKDKQDRIYKFIVEADNNESLNG